MTTLETEKIDKAYSDPSLIYDIRGMFIFWLSYQSSLFYAINFFSKNIKKNHLEVAIGSGSFFRFIYMIFSIKSKSLKNFKIYGFDYAERMISNAKDIFKSKANFEIFKADARSLQFPNEFFESINIANSYHCFPHLEEVINELVRVLKKDGTIAVNALLIPGNDFKGRIAQKINDFGQKKGILHRPYSKDEIDSLMDKLDLVFVSQVVHGNSYYFVVKKE